MSESNTMVSRPTQKASQAPRPSTASGLQLKHRLSKATLVNDRQGWIIEHAASKRVLHVGCADVGFLEHNLERDRLLHAELEAVCAGVLGVDIDEPGIAQMKSLGIKTAICCDVSKESGRLISEIRSKLGRCDIIVCGEVLEHLLNYDEFLRGISLVAEEFDSVVLITVPNTFNVEGFLHLFFGIEYVHPDHKCYFSEVTLNTLLNQTGFRILDISIYTSMIAKSALTRLVKGLLRSTLLKFRPQFAEGVIARAVPAGGETS